MKLTFLCLVGNFPPPIHGASLVNEEFKKRLSSLGINLISIDLSASSLRRTWYARLSRLWKFLPGLVLYIKTLTFHKVISLFIGLSGGYGQFYDIFFVAIARLCRIQIFLDHQSYSYIHKQSFITRILTQVAGPNAIHIVLCEDMKQKLQDMYGSVQNVFLLSNVAVIDFSQPCSARYRETLKTVAFLGNISFEKGILEFLDVMARLVSENVEVRALISGPFQDQTVEAVVMERLSKLSVAEYIGPKYDDEKTAFYQEVDALIFPTKYINEAEPLTIHEAMSYGIPVIAWERGCIKSILTPDTGLVIEQTENFVSQAVEQIKLWKASPQNFQATSSSAVERFLMMRQKYSKSFDELLGLLMGSSLEE